MDYYISVNVKIKSVIQTNYDLKQQDYGQKLIITAEDYDINGTTARLFINKSDGTVNERIMTKENNSYTYTLDADDTSISGKTVFDVKYYKQGVRDSSASFVFNIIADRLGKLIESKDLSDSIDKAIERCNNAVADVESALLAELNIYNGYDKTTAGYAADVRQLNESIVGTYAEMIKKRIGILTTLKTTEKDSLVGAINELKEGVNNVNPNLSWKTCTGNTLSYSTNDGLYAYFPIDEIIGSKRLISIEIQTPDIFCVGINKNSYGAKTLVLRTTEGTPPLNKSITINYLSTD